MEGFVTNEPVLVEYIRRVESAYFDNPYHNSWHAADVVQATNYGILTSASHVMFPRLAKFSALLAAAVHDIGHIGVNNAFLITTSHQLALQYSDRSPLEMMHANKAFSLMLKPGCNVLEHFLNDDRVAIRKIIISMVLSTDNANHSALIENFTRMRVSDKMKLDESANDQLMLLSMLLHSMDVSNVARPWIVSRKWLELVNIEFYAQGDSERSAGIPVTPIMDRHTTTPVSQFQTGFISYVVKPLFMELNNAGMNVVDPLLCIEGNLSSWEAITSGKAVLADIDQTRGYITPTFIDEVRLLCVFDIKIFESLNLIFYSLQVTRRSSKGILLKTASSMGGSESGSALAGHALPRQLESFMSDSCLDDEGEGTDGSTQSVPFPAAKATKLFAAVSHSFNSTLVACKEDEEGVEEEEEAEDRCA